MLEWFLCANRLSGNGRWKKSQKNDALVGETEGSSDRSFYLGVAGGWGKVFGSSFYGGIDATLLGISGAMSVGEKSDFSFLYDPKATVRLGFAKCNLLVYAGGGMGALYAFSDKDKLQNQHGGFPRNKDGKNELLWTWHLRIGADFKVKGNWSVGAFYEYQRTLSHTNEGDPSEEAKRVTDVSLISDRLAFVFGYQM
jgi:opacity protein-like surface antigen